MFRPRSDGQVLAIWKTDVWSSALTAANAHSSPVEVQALDVVIALTTSSSPTPGVGFIFWLFLCYRGVAGIFVKAWVLAVETVHTEI